MGFYPESPKPSRQSILWHLFPLGGWLLIPKRKGSEKAVLMEGKEAHFQYSTRFNCDLSNMVSWKLIILLRSTNQGLTRCQESTPRQTCQYLGGSERLDYFSVSPHFASPVYTYRLAVDSGTYILIYFLVHFYSSRNLCQATPFWCRTLSRHTNVQRSPTVLDNKESTV